MTKDERNEYARNYYKLHKEDILKNNKNWRQNNKSKFNECVYRVRRNRAKKRKENGEKYIWQEGSARKKLLEKNIDLK